MYNMWCTGVHVGQKLMSQNFFKITWNDSQSVGKFHCNVDFERKKVGKKLWLVKVTHLHFFFLGLFSNLLLKVEAYYYLFMRTHGLQPLLNWSSHMRLSKFINCSWGPLGAHRKKWLWKFFFFSQKVEKDKMWPPGLEPAISCSHVQRSTIELQTLLLENCEILDSNWSIRVASNGLKWPQYFNYMFWLALLYLENDQILLFSI